MEKTQITKVVLTILILVALAVVGFLFSLLKSPKDDLRTFEGAIQGNNEELPPKVDEETAEAVREDLATPAETNVDKEEVREELSKPQASGELSEEEKERIRAELRK